jgi:hypothetical protein
MKPLAALLALTLLPGCVTIPIPPFGDEQQRGNLGDLKVSVSDNYTPRIPNQTPATASQSHAWNQFLATKPPTLHDK